MHLLPPLLLPWRPKQTQSLCAGGLLNPVIADASAAAAEGCSRRCSIAIAGWEAPWVNAFSAVRCPGSCILQRLLLSSKPKYSWG
jgi:hypothetical protein